MLASAELLQKGRYRVDSSAPIGSGSVYSAYDTTSNTNVCVKEIVLRLNKVTTLAQQENSRLAFEDAARRISEMRHDSILRVTDFYSEVGRQYLVLEHVDGDELQALLERDRSVFTLEKVLDWADQLLDAVHYLHNQKIIHKNIGPRNIRLSTTGRIKLLGLTVTDDTGNDLSTALSETIDGSLNFSALELIWDSLDAASQKVIVSSYDERSEKTLKEPADVRSDIYSIGATLYFLLTARTPVDPLERSIELLEGSTDPLRAPNTIDSRIAPEISEVVMRALEIKRENRYDSAMIMRQVLRTAVVRAKEREAVESQELEEAAAFLRSSTQQLRMPAGVIETFEAPAHTADTASEAEILAQKLREAEEMRLEAERRAAEAERLLREQQANRLHLEAQANTAIHVSNEGLPSVAEEDLLGITAQPVHVSNPPADTVEDEIHLSIRPQPRAKIDLRELAKAPEPVKAEPTVESLYEPTVDVREEDAYLLETSPEDEKFASPAPETESGPTFSSYSYEDEPTRSGLPMRLIAGVAAVVVIAAAAGYMFLGGSAPAAPESQSSAAQQPQAPAEQPAVEVPAQTTGQQPGQQVNSFNDTEPQPVEPTAEEPATKPVQTAKAKPSAKKSAPAKKVTVDDLINDN